MFAVRNFIFIVTLFIILSLLSDTCYCSSLLLCIFNLNLFTNEIAITSEDVCYNIRNVNFIREMHFMPVFITVVCIFFFDTEMAQDKEFL